MGGFGTSKFSITMAAALNGFLKFAWGLSIAFIGKGGTRTPQASERFAIAAGAVGTI